MSWLEKHMDESEEVIQRLAAALKRVLPLARDRYEWLEDNGLVGGEPLAALDEADAALREAGVE